MWLIPALPLLGSLLLGLAGRRMSSALAATVGSGSVGLSLAAAAAAVASFWLSPPTGGSITLTLWEWVRVGSFSPSISLVLDALSSVMILVVTLIGFLIHVYSARFMAGEDGYSRFFAYMNLFVGSMLILVLAGNLLLLYLGWEGVGLCSYLLIGFWYSDPENGRSARKAFIVTRIGDVSLALGLFLLATNLGSLDIQEMGRRAVSAWAPGSALPVITAALLLGGAVGKSAQLPLQTWLPDAMAGPSPVSALIHAATMVTAGVYLIARTHALFQLAPAVMTATAIIGTAGILVAGLSALTQTNIKRVLAYSTMSQLGYMFLALGVGAWSGAIFHLVTHAFFKSLLFLAAGVVILAMNHEHDIFAMGGLARKTPFAFWTFLLGALALTALPPTTAGFASKELILSRVWESGSGGRILWVLGLARCIRDLRVYLQAPVRGLRRTATGRSRGPRRRSRRRGRTCLRQGGARGRQEGSGGRSRDGSAPRHPCPPVHRGRPAGPAADPRGDPVPHEVSRDGSPARGHRDASLHGRDPPAHIRGPVHPGDPRRMADLTSGSARPAGSRSRAGGACRGDGEKARAGAIPPGRVGVRLDL